MAAKVMITGDEEPMRAAVQYLERLGVPRGHIVQMSVEGGVSLPIRLTVTLNVHDELPSRPDCNGWGYATTCECPTHERERTA